MGEQKRFTVLKNQRKFFGEKKRQKI